MLLFYFVALLLFTSSEGIKNYVGTDIQKCFNCLCHARTGRFSRYNCAGYSIDYDYWKAANSPVIDESDDRYSQESYRKCMRNKNCIYATLEQYADAIGHMDCNCDGKFDCKDRFAIHLNGADCTNPKFNKYYVRRFNTCAKSIGVSEMLEKEGYDGCNSEVF